MLPAGGSRMEWTLRLVGMGIDGQSRSFDMMTISRPDRLGDIANLGMTLCEAKQLLVQVQQQLVAEQANTHAMFRPDCRTCGGTCHVKDWQRHRIATLFGEVRVRLPRLVCAGCGCGETAVRWPSHCRSTPELNQLQARLSALMPYRVAAEVMQHLLPIDAGTSPGNRSRSSTYQLRPALLRRHPNRVQKDVPGRDRCRKHCLRGLRCAWDPNAFPDCRTSKISSALLNSLALDARRGAIFRADGAENVVAGLPMRFARVCR
jgi:hypothetical protein